MLNKTRIWVIPQKFSLTYLTFLIRLLLLQMLLNSLPSFQKTLWFWKGFTGLIFGQNRFTDAAYSAHSELADASMVALANNWGHKIFNPVQLAWNCLDRPQCSGCADRSSSCSQIQVILKLVSLSTSNLFWKVAKMSYMNTWTTLKWDSNSTSQ